MSRIYRNPSIKELVEGIRQEDLGVIPKSTKATIVALAPATSGVVGSEVVAMQMAIEQASKLANMVG